MNSQDERLVEVDVRVCSVDSRDQLAVDHLLPTANRHEHWEGSAFWKEKVKLSVATREPRLVVYRCKVRYGKFWNDLLSCVWFVVKNRVIPISLHTFNYFSSKNLPIPYLCKYRATPDSAIVRTRSIIDQAPVSRHSFPNRVIKVRASSFPYRSVYTGTDTDNCRSGWGWSEVGAELSLSCQRAISLLSTTIDNGKKRDSEMFVFFSLFGEVLSNARVELQIGSTGSQIGYSIHLANESVKKLRHLYIKQPVPFYIIKS